MRLVLLLGALAACGHHEIGQVVRPAVAEGHVMPRLLPPQQLIDLDAPDAVYRTALALQLQPSWAQFLDDCRLRLPPAHPLNSLSLAATAQLAVDAGGRVASVHVVSSGNADFDQAVRQVIADAEPLPRPPRALWGDDDLVHVDWLFARDRRQAGPATARITTFDLPVRQVVHRLVGAGDLARAATRVRRAPHGADRDAATYELMIGALREAAVSSMDGVTRRMAIDAIGRAHVIELSDVVRDLFATTSDLVARITALDAAAKLSDRAIVSIIVDRMRPAAQDDHVIAVWGTKTLVELGGAGDAASVLTDILSTAADPDLAALSALAYVHVPELAPRVLSWIRSADAHVRGAACRALAQDTSATASSALARALGDRDSTVRASCLEAVVLRPLEADRRTLAKRVLELTADRDEVVRQRAIAAIVKVDPERLPDASTDPAAQVRVSFAQAMSDAASHGAGVRVNADRVLRSMLEDRDPDVRQAAWEGWLSLATGPTTHAERASLATKAVRDPAAPVRTTAVAALDDDKALVELATADSSVDVRTAATVTLAARLGRNRVSDMLLEWLAKAPPASPERVRTALAWLLAR